MNFVSYAQNFEDVMLWRALGHIENGFYIDVGAHHPIVDSVSKAFYDHGWRGVNVEPTHQYSSLLRENRPDELVLQKAIGDKSVSHRITFYEFQDTGLSTADKDIALQHQKEGFECRITEVNVTTLDDLIQNCGHQEIHWLKIDVEGFEKNVLESWTENTILPWIVVIESTKPLTSIESFNDWEHLLLAKHYIFTYFDGLNRYYISPEHPEIIEYFNVPPNFFDGFVLSESQPFCKFVNTKLVHSKDKAQKAEDKAQKAEDKAQKAEDKAQKAEDKAQKAEDKAQKAEDKAQKAEDKAQKAEDKAQKAEDKATDAQQRVHHFEQTITAIYTSRSWRITYPMRWSFHQAHLLREHGVKSRSKALVRKVAKLILNRAFNYVDGRPQLRHKLLSVLHKLGIYARLKSIYLNRHSNQIGAAQHSSIDSGTINFSDLSPRAQQIYDDLKVAIEKNKEQQ